VRQPLTIVLLSAVCGVVGCSSGGGTGPTATITAPRTVAPTTTSTTIALVPQSSPDEAANRLLAAWHGGDRAGAARVATPAAVATVFAHPPVDFTDRGCQDPIGGQASCAFGAGGGLVTVHTVNQAGGWLVDQVTFS
jgi:hypothetical protein